MNMLQPSQKLMDKANTLIEALPYIKQFYGKTIVVKYGGAAMVNDELKRATMEDIVLMRYCGMNPVLVHGGGPDITSMMNRLGLKPQFVNGQRYTDEATMDVVEMVLTGKTNPEIVAVINKYGGKATGISGKDSGLILARKFTGHESDENPPEDLGFVGDIERVNPTLIQALTSQGFIPVISPVGMDEKGQSYNINADLVAGAVAGALVASKLVLLTDSPGILKDPKDPSSMYHTLEMDEIDQMIEQKIISGGMIPKVEACLRALESGVEKTHIIDGRIPHALLLEIYTDEGVGTEIVG
jgi:acetylglutamate kinase